VKRDLPSPAEYHLYSLVLYTLRLRLATPSTKGESSVACVLRHVLCNTGCLALVPITKLPAALYVFPLSNTRIQARTTRSPQSRLRSPVAFRSLACVDEPNVYPQPSLFFLNFYLLSLPQQVIYRLTLHLLLKCSNANQTGSVLRSCRSPRIALC
jgi:hypothetical protein